jgi:hypothetical protein
MTVERFTSRGRSAERRRAAAREIGEELERIRRSEAKIAEALGSARAARQRVEELVRTLALEDEGVRDIVRQELRAAGGERSPSAAEGPPASETGEPPIRTKGGHPQSSTGEELDSATGERPSSGTGARPSSTAAQADHAGVSSLFRRRDRTPRPEGSEDASESDGAAEGIATAEASENGDAHVEEQRRSFWVVGVAGVGVFAIAVAGWLAYQAFRGVEEPPTLTVGGDSATPLGGPVAGANGVLQEMPMREDEASVEDADREADRFFALLPEPAVQRAAVYDSLWQAHSEVLTPLFERVEGATQESTVRRALEAWRAGSLTALQRDLLHSALVQYALREETGAELTVDGQLLRNPCRGASCSALLNFWETRGEAYGLPPVPEDAPRNTNVLRMAENVLVLKTLEGVHRNRTTNGR